MEKKNVLLEVPTTEIKQEIKINSHTVWRGRNKNFFLSTHNYIHRESCEISKKSCKNFKLV